MAPKLKHQILLDLKHAATQGTPSGATLPLPVPTTHPRALSLIVPSSPTERVLTPSPVNNNKEACERRTLSWRDRKQDFHYSSKSLCDRL